MNIRPAIRADLVALVALNQPSQAWHARLRPDIIRSPDAQDMTPLFADFLVRENFRVIVAEERGKLVGYVVYELQTRSQSPITCARRSIYVHQMSVAPKKQRHGIGKALLLYVQTQARAQGRAAIELDVWSANQSAKKFYKALGFAPQREVLEWRV